MVYVDNIVECMFMASDVVFFSFFSCLGVIMINLLKKYSFSDQYEAYKFEQDW